MIKDPDKLLDEEMHWVRSGRVLNAGTSVPMELECAFWYMDLFTTSGILQTSSFWDFYGCFIIVKLDHLLYPFPIPLPFRNMEGRDESPKLLMMV